MCLCKDYVILFHVGVGADGLLVAVTKLLRTAEKGWFYTLLFVRGQNTFLLQKINRLRNVTQTLGFGFIFLKDLNNGKWA
jgi:hypothetical protein